MRRANGLTRRVERDRRFNAADMTMEIMLRLR
jgi:hypothetical protein